MQARWWLLLLGLVVLTLPSAALGADQPAAPAAVTTGSAAQPDSLDALVDLLATKGVLTAEEAAAVKQRAAEKAEKEKAAAAAAAAAATKPIYPTLKIRTRLEARWSEVQKSTGQPYWGERDDQTGGDGFAVRRLRLHMNGALNPDIGYFLVWAYDWGAANPTLLVGNMEWNGWKDAKLSVGMPYLPFGWEIQQNDADYLPVDISTVSLLIPPDKDMGIRLDSKRPLLGVLNYQLALANGSGRNVGNPNHSYLTAGRVFVKPNPELSIGASASLNPNTDTSSYQSRFLKNNLTAGADPYGLLPAYAAKVADEKMVGADLQWHRGPDTVLAEWMRLRIEAGSLHAPVTADGWFVNYLHALPYASDPDKLELILGVQKFDPNTAVSDKYDQTGYTLGFNYHIRESERYTCPPGTVTCGSVLRVNYIWNHEPVSVKNNKWVLQYQTWF
jgi:hypothetical protein